MRTLGHYWLTLKDVREQQLKENRPVYFHGFTAKQPLLDFGWQEFDPKNWQDLPDGSICVMDECQNEFPSKIQGPLPEYINAVAQYRRKRGFDFWMLTPHPMMIHPDIRRLIESPSWHRHIKRTAGATMVSELKFNYAETQCEKPGSGARGVVTMRAYPKEVYDWYESASLHTGKLRIPKQVFVLAVCALLVPLLGYFGYTAVYSNVTKHAKQAAPAQAVATPTTQPQSAVAAPMTAAEYVAARSPRLAGFPHTAPAYDQVTAPAVAPYPAACVQMGPRCECYTQQATLLQVKQDICLQIVKRGFFIDWQQHQQQQQGQPNQFMVQQQPQHQQQAPQARTVPVPAPTQQQPGQISQADVTTALRLRNPQHSGLPHTSSH